MPEAPKGWKFLSNAAAMRMLDLADEVHAGKRSLTPEIVEKKRQIAVATRNAYLFIVRTGTVDYSMIHAVTELRLQLDTLYGQWAESEAPTISA